MSAEYAPDCGLVGGGVASSFQEPRQYVLKKIKIGMSPVIDKCEV